MIRTFAVLAGGSLGFAAVLMLANPPTPEPGVTMSADRANSEKVFAQFESDIDEPKHQSVEKTSSDQNPDHRITSVSTSHSHTKKSFVDTGSALYRLQVELVRMDCFSGPVDGTWSLSFHETLSDVALTAELDLKTIGTTDRVLTVLRQLDIGACGASTNVAAHHSASRSAKPDQRTSEDIRPVTVEQIAEKNKTKAQVRRQADTPSAPIRVASFEQSLEIEAGPTPQQIKSIYSFPIPRGRHAEHFITPDIPSADTQLTNATRPIVVDNPKSETRSPDVDVVSQGSIQETIAVDPVVIIEPDLKERSELLISVNTPAARSNTDHPSSATNPGPTNVPVTNMEDFKDTISVVTIPPLPRRKETALTASNYRTLHRQDRTIPDNPAKPRNEAKQIKKRNTPRSKQRSVKQSRPSRTTTAVKRVVAKKYVPKRKVKKKPSERSWKHNRAAIFSSRG